MKVFLLTSYLGGNEPPVFPLGLACIKSGLNGHTVKAFDMNISGRAFEELQGLVGSFHPDVIGISLRNIDSTNKRKVVFYYKYVKKTIDVIKSCSNAKIIIGGSGFSMFAKEIMEDEPRIDFGVYLEGETVFPKLLENLDTPENTKSVYYRKNGEILFSGSCALSHPGCLNMPNIGLLPLDEYKKHRDSIGVETKRGCSLSCIYCVYPFLNGSTYRLKPPGLVVDEIERLVNDHDAECFMFIDSVFNIPIAHAEEVCREIIRRRVKVKWSAWFNEKHLTGEFLDLVKEAGCDIVMLSPDGFSDDILKKLGKNLTRRDILKAYDLLKEVGGLEISYNFFKNPPGQNLRNFILLFLFFIKAKLKLRKKVHFEFNSLRIEPHTKLYDIALSDGNIKQEQSLLFPRYYTNQKTWYIGKLFDAILWLKGK